MTQTILTPTAVTRKALMILHNKLFLAKKVDRQYDATYKDSGAVTNSKFGPQLKVRLPNQYTVRTGKTIDVQDTAETSVTIDVSTQKGVDTVFSTAELTLSMDDFAERILEPGMARLAGEIENSGFALYSDIYNSVGTAGTTPSTMLVALQAGQKLDENLAPRDRKRFLAVNPAAMAGMVDGYKGLFQSSEAIKNQYETGLVTDPATGFVWGSSAVVNSHTNSAGVVTSITVNDSAIAEGATDVTVNTTTTAYSTGTIVTFAGCYAVNPETKNRYSHLQQFVVQSGTTATNLVIQPAIYTTGALQNVSAVPTDSGAVTVVGSADGVYPQNMAFHKSAFALVTADLEDVSKFGAWGAREEHDGISLRIARQYDINSDNIPCRIDVLYGWKTLRAALACRIPG